jgi:hypothetical protein
MTVTNYDQWVKDGSPWHPAKPVLDFAAILRGHGFTVYEIGAVDTHLDIPTPEDHAPFSHTPWPGAQPYPAVLALDIMPGGDMDWRDLGAKIVADKKAGAHGTDAIKYINWTDRAGNCWHDSWEPNHAQRPSSDRGHIHVSFRTDFVVSSVMSGYDPIKGFTVPVSNNPSHLDEDGELGPKTISRWQRVMGTPDDGVITQPPGRSSLVEAVQRKLNAVIHAGLVVDGQGINQDGRYYETTKALQRYLGTPQDGRLTLPSSMAVKALQHRLNGGSF